MKHVVAEGVTRPIRVVIFVVTALVYTGLGVLDILKSGSGAVNVSINVD